MSLEEWQSLLLRLALFVVFVVLLCEFVWERIKRVIGPLAKKVRRWF